VKFFGRSNDRLPWTFDVFEEVRRLVATGLARTPKAGGPRQVADGDTLFTARLVKDLMTRSSRPGDRYGDVDGGTTATARRSTRGHGKRQWPHYIVCTTGVVAGPLGTVSDSVKLMDALGAGAFGQHPGERKAGGRKPESSRVSQAAGGCEARRRRGGVAYGPPEYAFGIYGCVPRSKLAALDWPT